MRRKFTGGSRMSQKQLDEKAKKFETRSGGTSSPWRYLVDGRNVIRILPPHDPTNPAFELYRTSQLEVMAPVWKDGEPTEEKTLRRKKIVSAMVHSKELSKLGVKGDPVELYVKMVKDHAFDSIKNKDERKSYLAPINGYRANGKWVWGIEPKSARLCYVLNEDDEVAYFEMSKSWYDDMNRLVSEMEEEGGEPLLIDPFSDPVNGFPLVITKGRNDAGKTEYIVDKENPSRFKKESWDDFFKRTAVTDEQLDALDKKTPLADSFRDGYSLRDFEYQIEGLKRFDAKYEFGFFDTDEFQDAIANIKSILEAGAPADADEDDNEVVTKKSEKPTETAEETQAEEEPEVEEKPKTVKKAPVKKAPAKKVIKKKAGPTVKEMTDKVAAYITEIYGDEYLPQIPTDEEGLKAWFDTVGIEEANGDLPLVAAEDFEVPTAPAPEVEPEPEVEEPEPAMEAEPEVEPEPTVEAPKPEAKADKVAMSKADEIRAKIAARKRAK